MLAVAVAYTPAAWPLGVAALIAALPGTWATAGTLGASAAMITCGIGVAAGTLPLPAAAAEGALILAYLLALDLAESRLTGGSLAWIRNRGPALAAGFAAALLTAGAAETTFPAAPWLVVAGRPPQGPLSWWPLLDGVVTSAQADIQLALTKSTGTALAVAAAFATRPNRG